MNLEPGDIVRWGKIGNWGVYVCPSPYNHKLTIDMLIEPDHWVRCWCGKTELKHGGEPPDIVWARAAYYQLIGAI